MSVIFRCFGSVHIYCMIDLTPYFTSMSDTKSLWLTTYFTMEDRWLTSDAQSRGLTVIRCHPKHWAVFLFNNVVFFALRAKDKTDLDVLRENHRFLWRDEDEEEMTWWSSRVSISNRMSLISSVLSVPSGICLAANTEKEALVWWQKICWSSFGLHYSSTHPLPGKKSLPRSIMTSCLRNTA